ncbi:MAG: hypothetical protein ABJF67_06085 [Aurantimonas coralicida]|uniref:hypothetical protein n=1 Tax=Aurantimonas TaxID=182269 RepID=UPI001D17E51F|nr:hypothetical protein [Aurantimonas coralicida]MCC4299215.1 hypothetical protein [Aurantimonas coralicida]
MTEHSSRFGDTTRSARIARVESVDSASTDAREAQGFLVRLKKQNAALTRLLDALNFEGNGSLQETPNN